MNLVKVCDEDGLIKKEGAGYWEQCCLGGWFAGVYVAGYNNYRLNTGMEAPGIYPCAGETDGTCQQIFQSISVRSDGQSGDTFDLPINIAFWIEDPDEAGAILPVFTEGEITIELTVGYDTGTNWEYFGSLTGGTIDTEGSLGTPITAYIPDLEIWINAFRAVGRFSRYKEPPEYGIPLICNPPGIGNFDCWDLQSMLPSNYPVKWLGAFEAANELFDLDPDVDMLFNRDQRGGEDTFYYDPISAGRILDVVPSYGPTFMSHAFFKSLYATPLSKTTDNVFDIIVKFRHIYQEDDLTCENFLQGFPRPDVRLVFPIDNEAMVYQDIVPMPDCGFGAGYDCQASVWKITGCQFLCRAGTKKIDVWDAIDSYGICVGNSSAQLGFVDFWKIRSGPIRVDIGIAKFYAVYMVPDSNDLTVVAGAYVRDEDDNPLTVRILDAAAERSRRYNIVPTATPEVTVVLTDLGGNFYTTPDITGYLDDKTTAVAGVADFTSLKVFGLGRNYRLEFSAPSPLESAGSDIGFDRVNLSVACDLRFDDIGPILASAGVDFDIVVNIVDQDINLITTATDDLTLDGEGSFTGFATLSPSGGFVTFNGNFPVAGTYDIFVKTSLDNYDGPNEDDGDIPNKHISVIVT